MFAAENYQSRRLGKRQTLRGQVLPHLSRQIHAYMIQEAALKWFFRDTDSNNMCNIYWTPVPGTELSTLHLLSHLHNPLSQTNTHSWLALLLHPFYRWGNWGQGDQLTCSGLNGWKVAGLQFKFRLSAPEPKATQCCVSHNVLLRPVHFNGIH